MKICYNQKIAAGIVLFNPEDNNRVSKCINSIKKQVEKIYIFDNSNKDIRFCIPEDVIYISEKSNKGIAYALNCIMEHAKRDGYEWVITMDQDSIVPDNMISDFENYMLKDENLAIICPQVIDKRRAYMNIQLESNEEYVDMCITSASCTSIKAWERVGKFDEWLFIDLVDNEFCKRLIVSGYKILRLNKWILDQEFGKIIPKSRREQKVWIKLSEILHNKNIAKLSYKKFVSPLRVYYTNRNIIYVNKKLKKYGTVAYENYNCRGYVGFLISFVIPSILRASDRKEVFKATYNGIIDGAKKTVIPWNS